MQGIADEAFAFLQYFLERESGIVIGDNKRYLLEARLAPLLRDEGCAGFDELVSAMRGYNASRLGMRIIESMTTHETLWFRDRFPFDFFRDTILKGATEAGAHGLRVWSAACATGQEPYSLAILVAETLSHHPVLARGIKITATDISEAALRHAREGRYDALSLRRGMDEHRLNRFFDELDGEWKIRPEVASYISFRPVNLLANFSMLGMFDTIFCRNVLIYFSSERKQDILDRMIRSLAPGGHLFLGASEAIPESLVGRHQLVRKNSGGGIYLKPPV